MEIAGVTLLVEELLGLNMQRNFPPECGKGHLGTCAEKLQCFAVCKALEHGNKERGHWQVIRFPSDFENLELRRYAACCMVTLQLGLLFTHILVSSTVSTIRIVEAVFTEEEGLPK